MEKIEFFDVEENETVCFYVLEQTVLNEQTYLLVSDRHPDEDDAECFILHAEKEEGAEITYNEVSDEGTLHTLSGIFNELLDGIEVQ